MSGYPYPDDYYTAMVTAASNYHDVSGHPLLPSPAATAATLATAPHGRSNTYSSANSSTSTGSNNPACPRYASYRPNCQRLPTSARATFGAPQSNASLTSNNTSVSSPATTTKTYTHNPYSSIVTAPMSKDSSFNTSMDSYQSFQATYGDPAANYPSSYQPLRHQHQHQHQYQSYPYQPSQPPRTHGVPQTTSNAGTSGGSSFATTTVHLSQQQQQQQQGPTAQPVYAPAGGDSRMLSSNMIEQFVAAVGNLASTACTSRGRHLLISILRLQHLDKIELIYQELLPRLNTVALDPQGCHVLRTLIEFITVEQLQAMLPCYLPKTILDMATSTQNTRRTLQAMFERHKTTALTPVVEIIASDSQRLATTQQGCIAIMRIIEHSLPEQKQLLVASILPVLPTLTMDPYGNYVVQCVLDTADDVTTVADVCLAFTGHWVPLSCNKFASNVMEKVVRQMDNTTRAGLVAELVYEPQNLQCLMQDGFGNFVLQAIIVSATDAEEFGRIYELVEELVHTSPYGHKIEAKLRTKYATVFGKEPVRSKAAKEPKDPKA